MLHHSSPWRRVDTAQRIFITSMMCRAAWCHETRPVIYNIHQLTCVLSCSLLVLCFMFKSSPKLHIIYIEFSSSNTTQCSRKRRPRLRCRHLANRMTYASSFISAHSLHYAETWRRPLLSDTVCFCLSVCLLIYCSCYHYWWIKINIWNHDSTLHCRQRRTEPRPQITCTENLVKLIKCAVLR